MSEHLSAAVMSALVDGELTAEQMAAANAHLAGCPACTSSALAQAVLKRTTAAVGQRQEVPEEFAQRMRRVALGESPQEERRVERGGRRPPWQVGWAVAAVLAVSLTSVVMVEHRRPSAETAAMIEARDLHVAALAAAAPEVLSTDRHTVKPWFQGKLPFSFNLPDGLPEDVRLEGGNLVYLHGQPVAQLVYSVGKHRASVFLSQREGVSGDSSRRFEGFGVEQREAGALEITAVSDVEASRLVDLVERIQRVQ